MQCQRRGDKVQGDPFSRAHAQALEVLVDGLGRHLRLGGHHHVANCDDLKHPLHLSRTGIAAVGNRALLTVSGSAHHQNKPARVTLFDKTLAHNTSPHNFHQCVRAGRPISRIDLHRPARHPGGGR